MFTMYGASCALCGYTDKRALSLDHIAGGGSIERRKLGAVGSFRVALVAFRPDKYRVLCMNCQFIEKARMHEARSEAHLRQKEQRAAEMALWPTARKRPRGEGRGAQIEIGGVT
jgi:hypothetical protein